MKNINTATAVSSGMHHSCALLDNKTIQCWGYGAYGQMGRSDCTNCASDRPIPVSNITTATQVSSGQYHTCAVLEDKTVQCWGLGNNGVLGIGSSDNSSVPVTVSNITDATLVRAGKQHSCAVLSDGSIQCWGLNSYGQLGNGTTENSSVPVTVKNINNATSVSLGERYTCALLSNGSIKCWGKNDNGLLGQGDDDNTHDDSLIPIKVKRF